MISIESEIDFWRQVYDMALLLEGGDHVVAKVSEEIARLKREIEKHEAQTAQVDVLPSAAAVKAEADRLARQGWELLPVSEPMAGRVGFVAFRTPQGGYEEVREFYHEPFGPVKLEVVEVRRGWTHEEIDAAFARFGDHAVYKADDPKSRLIGFACYGAGVALTIPLTLLKERARDAAYAGRTLSQWREVARELTLD